MISSHILSLEHYVSTQIRTAQNTLTLGLTSRNLALRIAACTGKIFLSLGQLVFGGLGSLIFIPLLLTQSRNIQIIAGGCLGNILTGSLNLLAAPQHVFKNLESLDAYNIICQLDDLLINTYFMFSGTDDSQSIIEGLNW